MTVRTVQWTLDVVDVRRMTAFWSAALGHAARTHDDGSVTLHPTDEVHPSISVLLQPTTDPTPGKNRCHPDLLVGASDGDDGPVEAEVERLLALGASHRDVGQSAQEPFVVLADPEGNEFCVLRRDPRRGPTQPDPTT